MQETRRNQLVILVAILAFILVLFGVLADPRTPLPVVNAAATPDGKIVEIKARSGYSLSTIASDLGTDWKEMAGLSGLENPNMIYPGQKLKAHAFKATDIVEVSWYESGKTMANGEMFNPDDATVVAHKWLPFGTKVRLTRIDNSKSVDVVVQDRGPYIKGRIFDLSRGAAKKLNMLDDGVVTCKVQILD